MSGRARAGGSVGAGRAAQIRREHCARPAKQRSAVRRRWGSCRGRAPKRAIGNYRTWADLLRRTFGEDVIECPKCKGRMKLIAMVTDPSELARYLAHVGEPTNVPAALRAAGRRTGKAPSCADRRSTQSRDPAHPGAITARLQGRPAPAAGDRDERPPCRVLRTGSGRCSSPTRPSSTPAPRQPGRHQRPSAPFSTPIGAAMDA